ncbi:MAG TPA: hypothetical protein VM012_00100 [Flavitalea sp.]|nr:hypothetical protein [Flavitalea sp.]
MKTFFLITVSLLISGAISAQSDSLQQEINDQVWKPFIKAFSELDTDGFMHVHSTDMTRVIQDGKQVQTYEQYYQSNRRGDDRARLGNRKRKIELRFIQRIAGNGRAFEVGYYKTTNVAPDGKEQNFYGKFQVLLRKESGTWKIIMDADARADASDEVFKSAAAMEN